MDSKPNDEIDNHFAGHQVIPEEKNKCYICDKTYLNEKNLQDHVRRLHENAKSYECGRCKKIFTRMSNLNRHLPIFMVKQALIVIFVVTNSPKNII